MFEMKLESNFSRTEQLLFLILKELEKSRELTEKIINESKLSEVKIEATTKKKR